MLAGLTTLIISIVAFVLIQLPPGDFASTYVQLLISDGLSVNPNQLDLAFEAQIRSDLGLDRPLVVQYAKWAWRVIKLGFGNSIRHS